MQSLWEEHNAEGTWTQIQVSPHSKNEMFIRRLVSPSARSWSLVSIFIRINPTIDFCKLFRVFSGNLIKDYHLCIINIMVSTAPLPRSLSSSLRIGTLYHWPRALPWNFSISNEQRWVRREIRTNYDARIILAQQTELTGYSKIVQAVGEARSYPWPQKFRTKKLRILLQITP